MHRSAGLAVEEACIGRNILYADWHIGFLQAGDSADTYFDGSYNVGSSAIDSGYVDRGTEEGCIYNSFDGRKSIAWDIAPAFKAKG